MKKKYIISGPAGSGKSSLIASLQASEYECMPEASRRVITSEQLSGNNGLPWQNIERFTKLAYEQTRDDLKQLMGATFSDRSLIDHVAYLKHANKPVPRYLEEVWFESLYHPIVFFCPPWEDIYQTDPQRPHRFEDQASLSIQLTETYEQMGFELVFLPKTSTEERTAYVLDQVASFESGMMS